MQTKEEVTMYQNVWRTGTFAAIACALAIGATAQTSDPAQRSAMPAADKVTITGCVQRADATPVGTSGAVGETTTASKFILATPVASSSGATTTGTTGTSGTTKPDSSAVTTAINYRLDADDSKLAPHVGHKVEITGTLDPASVSPPPASESAAAPMPPSPKVKVDSVKMIASSCS
jgi:hypothetical protein